MTRLAFAAAMMAGLSACSTASTDDIGSPVEPTKLTNAPGMTSFAVDMNSETGIPESVAYSNAKDDTGSLIETIYEFDPQTGSKIRVSYRYSIDSSKGSEQTKAVLAAVEAVADAQAETAQAIGPEAMRAVVEGLRIGFGVP